MQSIFKQLLIYKIIFGIMAMTILGYGLWTQSQADTWYHSGDDQVCVWIVCIDAQIADTPASRQRGLMEVELLPQGSGMLFVFETDDTHSFWMKNTLIPLDMIWIDTDGKIVDIQTAIPCTADPCQSYIPMWPARYVLEINAWLSELLGRQKNTILQFSKK